VSNYLETHIMYMTN